MSNRSIQEHVAETRRAWERAERELQDLYRRMLASRASPAEAIDVAELLVVGVIARTQVCETNTKKLLDFVIRDAVRDAGLGWLKDLEGHMAAHGVAATVVGPGDNLRARLDELDEKLRETCSCTRCVANRAESQKVVAESLDRARGGHVQMTGESLAA